MYLFRLFVCVLSCFGYLYFVSLCLIECAFPDVFLAYLAILYDFLFIAPIPFLFYIALTLRNLFPFLTSMLSSWPQFDDEQINTATRILAQGKLMLGPVLRPMLSSLNFLLGVGLVMPLPGQWFTCSLRCLLGYWLVSR